MEATNELTETRKEIAEFKAELAIIAPEAKKLHETLIEAEHARFIAAGGCKKCNGRKVIVVWDTMDIMDGSCAVFVCCPECDGKNEEFNYAVSSKYDAWNGTGNKNLWDSPLPLTPVAKTLYDRASALYQLIDNYERVAISLFRCLLKPGCKVKITKGAKAKKGFVGVIAYTGNGRILVKEESKWKDRRSDGHWATEDQLEVL